MKKLFFPLVCAFLLVTAACSSNDNDDDHDNDNDSIVGTWIGLIEENEETYSEIVVFTDNNTFSVVGTNTEDSQDTYTIQGTYQLDGNVINLAFIEDGEPDTESATYSISNDILTLKFEGDSEQDTDTFTRQ